MENILIDYRNELQQRVNEFCSLTEKYAEKKPDVMPVIQDMRLICQDRLKNFKPRIMIYGIYNAGKSSIINELIREDKAKVQDIPTTDSVDSYEWNGYTIDDTPGVGAPMKHEEVTQAHLKRADIVLFVMSTTGANELKQNYERMKDIVDAGKKLIIVLNDKNSHLETNDNAIQQIKMKVIEHMEQVGIGQANANYHFVVVNARRAHKGRIEHKTRLWQKSHMEELEQVMLTELKRAGGFEVLQRAIRDVEHYMEQAIGMLSKVEGDKQIEVLHEVLVNLQEKGKQMKENLNRTITLGTQHLGTILPQLIWNESQQGEKTVEEDVVNQLIKKHESHLIEKIDKELSFQFEDICHDVSDLLQEQLESKVLENSQDLHCTTVEKKGVRESSLQEVSNKVQEICNAENAITAGNFDSSKVDTNVGEEVLKVVAKGKALEEIGSSVGKALLGTELGSILGKSTFGKLVIPWFPPIGTILTIIGIAKLLFGDHGEDKRRQQEAEMQNERMRQIATAKQQAREELQQNFQYYAEDMRSKLLAAVFSNIELRMKILREPVVTEIQQLKSDTKSLMTDIDQMHHLLNGCEELRCQITDNKQIC